MSNSSIKPRSEKIEWPIVVYWLTYLSIVFGIVWAFISEGALAVVTSGTLRVKSKGRRSLVCALLLVVLAVEGCATVRGVGEDIQSLGNAIKRAFSG